MPIPCCFGYYRFVAYFEVREFNTSCFVLFFSGLLWIFGGADEFIAPYNI
jgi:hypothetical protein